MGSTPDSLGSAPSMGFLSKYNVSNNENDENSAIPLNIQTTFDETPDKSLKVNQTEKATASSTTKVSL